MNWKVWIHSLLSAALGGAASALGGAIVAPSVFNFTSDGMTALAKVALFGAIVPVLALLKQSPLPSLDTALAATQKITTTILVAALALSAAATVSGCTDWERQSYQSLAASKATIDQAQADYESGKLPHSAVVYQAITKAKAAQTAAVEALLAYEQVKGAGAATNKVAAAQSTTTSLLAELPSIIASIKTLYQGVQ